MKSKKAEMKDIADTRNFVPGMLRDVSIARLRLGCDRKVHAFWFAKFGCVYVNMPPFLIGTKQDCHKG